MVERKKVMEEELREAACFGDLIKIEELLMNGVDVNSQNDLNGWSALHWAAHRNFTKVVELLLRYGADKTSLTNKKETPFSLASSTEVQFLLEGVSSDKAHEKLPITPNYLKNLQMQTSNTSISKNEMGFRNDKIVEEEIVLKLRLANSGDLDFIEIELPKTELTYNKLVEICCQELNINVTMIHKIRKLPDTILRKDKDIQRLNNYQELEVVLQNVRN